MGFNELLLLLITLFSVLLVYISWKLDKERLYSVILVFLILISISGGKIVEFFGYQTNTGNIFYASIFLATYLLVERYGKREGLRSIWIGVIGISFFTVLLQLVVALIGSPVTGMMGSALSQAFAPMSRLAVASLCGYILSQSLNVFVYVRLTERFRHNHTWLRANISNLLAQIFDSAVFFSIAFWGVVAPANILEIMVTGFVVKVVFMMVAAPILYLNDIEQEEGTDYAMITLR